MREKVQHVLVGPLALIHIIYVFRESGKVYDAEIAAVSRESVRSRLADVVPAGPDELSRAERRVLYDFPSLLVRAAPRCVSLIVTAAHERRVGVGLVPTLGHDTLFIARHLVISARLKCRNALRHEERLAGEVLRHVLYPLTVVVEAYQIYRSTLEKMVVRVGFVASCRYGTGVVVAFHDVHKVLGKQGIDTHLSIFSQRRGIVSGIKDKVGLLKRQSVGLGRRPLF